jgi:predicted nucleic acid-binding protein
MVMPELFMTEVLSGLVRAANIDAGQFEAVNRKVARFFALHWSATFAVRSALPVLERAAEIAFKLRHPIKDCVYMALAEALKVPFVTADLKFATKARLQFGFIETLAD